MVETNHRESVIPEGAVPPYMLGDRDITGVQAEGSEEVEGLEAEVTDGVLVVASPPEALYLFQTPEAYIPNLTQTERDNLQFCTDLSGLHKALFDADYITAPESEGPIADAYIPGKIFFTGQIGFAEKGTRIEIDENIFANSGIDYAERIRSPL